MEQVPLFLLAVADQLAEGVLIATEEVRYINPSGLRLVGAERPEQVVGQPLSMFVGQDTVCELLEQAKGWWSQVRTEVRNTPIIPSIKGDLLGIDGCPMTVSLSAFPIAWAGEEAAAFLFLIKSDATDRYLVERAVMAEAQRRAESKMQTVGMLAAGIIHEVNNTLTAVLGYGQLASRLIPSDNKAHQHIQQVIAAGRKSSELVQRILMFARPGPAAKRPVLLHALAKEFLAFLRPAIPCWIEVQELIADSTTPVEADPGLIRQLLAGLIADAVHAMREGGGVLKIELYDEEITDDQVAGLGTPPSGICAGRYVCLRAKDCGRVRGAKEDLSVSNTLSRSDHLGEERIIGLSAVRSIVSTHGGHIWVEREPASGTGIVILFPTLAIAVPLDRSCKAGPSPKTVERG
ncbi:MAG: two-component system sensor histidine kinase NtrB [Nitrospira sp.]